MDRSTTRILIAALVGALAGSACVVIAFTVRPGLALEMDRDLPRRVTSGFYPPERAGDLTFVWTSGSAVLRLADLDRSAPWDCVLRFRGGGPELHRTVVDVSADGVTLVRERATHDFKDLHIAIPPGPRDGLALGITTSPTFVPGPSDPRQLGLQVDRLACRPANAALVLPPGSAIRAAAIGGAAFGTALALAGMSLAWIAGAVVLLAAGQAVLLSTGLAPYGNYPDRVLSLGLWIPLLALGSWKLLEAWSRRPLSKAATFAIFFSAAAFFLKALGLLHPSKLVIDALFHAHRLEWVLAGRYYFTQPMPSGVSFPYAIGLYVFASPWTMVTGDYMSLLRMVVSASEVIAGLLLYPLIVRTWGDRLMGVAAVVLFNMVPLPYLLIGNANMTNAFGQSVALTTLIAASLWPLTPRNIGHPIAFFLLTSLAFLSHISTFAQLFVALTALAAISRWRGDRALRPVALAVLLVTILAAGFSVVTYYGHFGEVYKAAMRMRAQSAAAGQQTPNLPASTDRAAPTRPAGVPLSARVGDAVDLTVSMIGWPILLLAGAGLWSLWADGPRDRLVFLLAAWGVAYLVFVIVGIVPSVDAPFQRYATEFVGRVNFATYPAAVILAGRGAVWAWRRNTLARIAAAILLFLSVAIGVGAWANWIA